MSLTFVAILGYLCEEAWTQPVILSIEIVDDVVLAMSEGQWLPNCAPIYAAWGWRRASPPLNGPNIRH
jgi:hypothetical protein